MTLVDTNTWQETTHRLAVGEASLLSLWGEPGRVHMAVFDTSMSVLTLECPDTQPIRRYRVRITRLRFGWNAPPATFTASIPSACPIRDPGWNTAPVPPPIHSCRLKAKACTRSLSAPSTPASSSPAISASLPMARRLCAWNNVLAYVHKGIDQLLHRATIEQGARLAGRTSGDSSTVAYAFALRARHGSGAWHRASPRAVWLRAVMAELERIANHLGDFGAICNDASFSIMLAHCGVLRERVLRTCRVVLRPPADDGLRRARRYLS